MMIEQVCKGGYGMLGDTASILKSLFNLFDFLEHFLKFVHRVGMRVHLPPFGQTACQELILKLGQHFLELFEVSVAILVFYDIIICING